MLKLITEPIIKVAKAIMEKTEEGLDPQDVTILKNDGPNFLRKVQTNIKLDKEPLNDLKDADKKVLLSYVIFLRQNVTMEKGDKPNEEDAAKIIHGRLFSESREDDKELEKELLKQLEKIGIEIKKNKN
jgi:hypothetical protein